MGFTFCAVSHRGVNPEFCKGCGQLTPEERDGMNTFECPSLLENTSWRFYIYPGRNGHRPVSSDNIVKSYYMVK